MLATRALICGYKDIADKATENLFDNLKRLKKQVKYFTLNFFEGET